MKPARLPHTTAETLVRVEFQVQFSGGPKGRRRAHEGTPSPSAQPEVPVAVAGTDLPEPVNKASLSSVPKITRLLVLGHHFEKLVRDGAVKDYSEIARLTGLSRARVTQIANLTLLAPEVQEWLMVCPQVDDRISRVSERDIRGLVTRPDWKAQKISISDNPISVQVDC